MAIKRVFVIGSGLMGGGIAQACAQAGLEVKLTDAQPEAAAKALKTIAWSVGKLVDKGRVKGSAEEIMARIEAVEGFGAAAQADLAIEAVFENLEIKLEVFGAVDKAAGPETIIASNTSAISISRLALATDRPDKVLGLHFFSPVPMMAAAEVIKGRETSTQTFEAGLDFVRSLDKEPIPVRSDVPGFVINRINYRANLEAMRLVEAGVATVEEIDRGLRLASGRKMGPFEIGDLVGLDVTHGALMAIYDETKDPYFYPPAVLRHKVAAGHLGRKSGRGWYTYNSDGTRRE